MPCIVLFEVPYLMGSCRNLTLNLVNRWRESVEDKVEYPRNVYLGVLPAHFRVDCFNRHAG
jgi:hypothetical protein